eukprot:56585-Eustigmatos_ZCMA.PRE.1
MQFDRSIHSLTSVPLRQSRALLALSLLLAVCLPCPDSRLQGIDDLGGLALGLLLQLVHQPESPEQ